jgi:hypothetical protein
MNHEESFSEINSIGEKNDRRVLAIRILATSVIVFLFILLGLFVFSKFTSFDFFNLNKTAGNDNNWRALFLTNGEVFFGHITRQNQNVVELKDVYYYKISRQSQAVSGSANAIDNQEQQLSLAKLGEEIHGPTDYLAVNWSQIMYIEKLRSDSRIVSAIKRYLEEQESK